MAKTCLFKIKKSRVGTRHHLFDVGRLLSLGTMEYSKTLTSGDFIASDETWELHFGDLAAMKALFSKHCLEMNRAVLFTLGAHYLSRTTYIAHRVTLVFKGGVIVGFAIINHEKFELPVYVTEWNGKERLSQKSPSFQEVQNKLHAPKRSYNLMHVAAIGCSPFATRGLGSRIVTFQKYMARVLGVPFIALEAIKPLNTNYYSLHGFQTASALFYPMSTTTNLVPMFYKVLDSDRSTSEDLNTMLLSLNHPVFHRDAWDAADRMESEKLPDCLWPADDPRTLYLEECAKLSTKIVFYLWNCRSNDDALECLRQLSVRAELNLEEIKKLWSMRFHSLNYENKNPLERTPLNMGTRSWLDGPRVSLTDDARSALLALYVS
jgi:hypothetical protein